MASAAIRMACVVPHGLVRPAGTVKPGGNLVQFLKNVFHRDALFKARADDLLERLLDLLADHEHQLAESRAHGVVDRVIDDGFAARAHRINLLQAAVAAAHAGSQNEQRRGCCGFMNWSPPDL